MFTSLFEAAVALTMSNLPPRQQGKEEKVHREKVGGMLLEASTGL